MSKGENNSPSGKNGTASSLAITPGGAAGEYKVMLLGDWLGRRGAFTPIKPPKDAAKILLDASQIGQWDSTFVAHIFRTINELKTRNIDVNADGLPEGAIKLLKVANAQPQKVFGKSLSNGFLNLLRKRGSDMGKGCEIWLSFVGELVIALWHLLTGRSRMRWNDVGNEVYKAGPAALFIVTLIGFLIGLILAFIGAIPLKWFRAEIYVASLIGIGMLRLMGAVMAGIVMAGRTGAAYAAEIGTMQVNEEIDALETMGISPIEHLVLPRFIALTLMMPLLCLYADLVGILGGMVVGVQYLDLSHLEYWHQMVETSRLNDLFVGLFSSFVFGILVAICGCLRGLHCGRDSAAVGQATTSSMVSSIICLVIATSIITVLTVMLGI